MTSRSCNCRPRFRAPAESQHRRLGRVRRSATGGCAHRRPQGRARSQPRPAGPPLRRAKPWSTTHRSSSRAPGRSRCPPRSNSFRAVRPLRDMSRLRALSRDSMGGSAPVPRQSDVRRLASRLVASQGVPCSIAFAFCALSLGCGRRRCSCTVGRFAGRRVSAIDRSASRA